MKYADRLLALLLCALLAVMPLCSALADDAGAENVSPAQTEEIAAERESEPEEPTQAAEEPVEDGNPDESDPAGDAGEGDESAQDAPDGEAGDASGETAPSDDGEPNERIDDPSAPVPEGGTEEETASPNGSDSTPDAPGAEGDGDSDDPGAGGDSDAPAIDYAQSALFSTAFHEGYAELIGACVAYAEAGAETAALQILTDGGVVYVLEREASAQADRLNAAFDCDGARTAWIDAAMLRPMSPEQSAAFVAERAAQAGVRFWNDAAELPLDALRCAPLEEGGDSGESDEGGEAEPTPRMSVKQDSFVLGKGESGQIEVLFDDGQAHGIACESLASGVARVSADGKLTAAAVGETDVAVRSEFGEELRVHVAVKKAPTKVTLSAARKTLGVGETLQLDCKLPDGAVSALTFSNNKSKAATVTPEGQMIALAAGTATITVKTFNKKTASVKLTVKPAPTSISLDAQALTLGIGQRAKLTATLSQGSAGAYSFRAEPEGVIDIDPATGEIVAMGLGEATVTAETYNRDAVAPATCAVAVKASPTEVSFAEAGVVIGAGESVTPQVILGAPGEDCMASLTFQSLNEKIATVSADGAVKGVKAGKTTIRVTTHNEKTGDLTVEVKKAPTKATLSAARKTLGVGEVLPLEVKLSSGSTSRKLTFTSSAPSIVSVDESGTVRAEAPGNATITVKTFNNKKGTVKLTVVAAPEDIALTPAELTLGIGQKSSVTAALTAGSAGAYSFRAEPEGIVDIDPITGEFTALSLGKATITAEAYNGASGAAQVEVKNSPSQVALNPNSAIIGAGEKLDAPEVILGAPGEDCMASWTFQSLNKKIATVGADGSVKGVKAGKTTIRVTTHNGKTGDLAVEVKKAPTKATLSAARKTLGVGEELPLEVKLSSGSTSRKLTFTSSAPNIVSVDESGTVKAEAPGAATITVKTYNGKKGTVKLTVVAAPEDIALTPAELTLGIGQKSSVTATLTAGSAGAYSFRAEPEGIIDIDPITGEIVALSLGEATITAEAYNGASGAAQVEVKNSPSQVALNPNSAIIGVGEKLDAPEVILGAPGEDCMASWTLQSLNKKIATVGADGSVKGVKAGKTTIRVTTHNGKTGDLALEVKKAPTKATLSAAHKTLGVGEVLPLEVKLSSGSASRKLTFTSSAPGVVSVDESGTVRAEAPGNATITVKTFNNKKGTIKLTVVAAPEGVSLPGTLALGVEEKYTIAAVTRPEGSGGGLTYSVDDPSVATIDAATGAIVAVGKGSTTVRVVTYNGFAAACALTVKGAPTGIELQDKSFKLSAGDTRQLLPPILQGGDVASGAIQYKSSSTKYVKVSATGLVTAVRAGKATITVSTYNKKKASITVTVKAAPKSISFAETEHRLFIDHEFVPEVKFSNGVASNYTLESSNPAVAQIVGDDLRTVRALAGGTVTITATSYNKKKTKTPLTVTVPFLPDSVRIEPAKLTLGEGDSNTMTAVMPAGQGAELEFWVDDPAVARLERIDNETVRVVAQQKGETTIRVRTQNGKESAATVAVLKAPTALSLTPSRAGRSLDEGSLQLRWGYGGAEEGGSVRFSSSDESVATVSGGGLVRFLAVGAARITAQTYNGHTAYCELTIGEKPGSMAFAQGALSIALGDSVQPDVTFDKGCESYALSSSNPAVVSTSGDVARGEGIGTATLTAVSRSGLRASCSVTVVEAPTGIELETPSLDLVIGCSSVQQVIAKSLPDGVGSVHYASSNPRVAAVDYATGEVTARDKGDCQIVATTYNGHSATCEIHVSYLLEGVKVGIDPGHQANGDMSKERNKPKGGSMKYKCASPGSGVAHVREDKIDLAIGLKLRDALVKLGAEVVMTRETANVNISNQQRAKLMNKNGVDLALRIHANASSYSSANGLSLIRRQTCYYTNKEVDPKQGTAKKLLANEARLSQKIGYYFRKQTGCGWRGHGTSDEYTMNNWCTVPCLLVEVGFMTNPTEGRLIVKSSYQDKMVKGMVQGICDYMGRSLPTEW